MTFRKVAVLGFLLFAAVWGSAKEAVRIVTPTGTASFVPGGAGLAFVVTNQTTLTALGYHLAQSTDQAIVELLDEQSNALASAYITATNAQVGQFWYQPLAGLALPVNRTNYIVAYDAVEYARSTNKVWLGTLITDSSLFAIAPEVKYLGPAEGNRVQFDNTSWLYYAVNFMFGPPRPPLYIQPTDTNSVLLLWPTQAVGFSLQGTANPALWPATNLPATAAVSGTNNVVVMPETNSMRFFRLRY